MEGISSLTDDRDNKIAVQIDLRKYGEMWEDFHDALIVQMRKNESETDWETVKKEIIPSPVITKGDKSVNHMPLLILGEFQKFKKEGSRKDAKSQSVDFQFLFSLRLCGFA